MYQSAKGHQLNLGQIDQVSGMEKEKEKKDSTMLVTNFSHVLNYFITREKLWQKASDMFMLEIHNLSSSSYGN